MNVYGFALKIQKMSLKALTLGFIFSSGFFAVEKSFADCTSPTTPDGAFAWVSASSKIMYCRGTTWVATADSATATSCSPAGTIQYNSPLLQYCNGSVWVTTSGATNYASCTGTTGGYFYYSTSDTYFWYCNGTNWKRVP